MPVKLEEMRDLLLPGLRSMTGSRPYFTVIDVPHSWNDMFRSASTVSVPTAIAMGAAAVVMKNPRVTRRFLPR